MKIPTTLKHKPVIAAEDYENIDGVIIPESMLRSGEEVLLDDYTISNIEEKLDTKVIVAKVVGSNFVDIFKKDVM